MNLELLFTQQDTPKKHQGCAFYASLDVTMNKTNIKMEVRGETTSLFRARQLPKNYIIYYTVEILGTPGVGCTMVAALLRAKASHGANK